MYEDLIVSAIPRAKTVARKYRGSLDRDEAVSIALLTLVEIAPRFDPARGVKFTTFASRRIIGALQDTQRQKDGITFAPRGAVIEHFQIQPNAATCRRVDLDYRTLKAALGELSGKELRVVVAYVTHSEGPSRYKAGARPPHEMIGMKDCTFHWYRRRALNALKVALEARGVRKVSDIL